MTNFYSHSYIFVNAHLDFVFNISIPSAICIEKEKSQNFGIFASSINLINYIPVHVH